MINRHRTLLVLLLVGTLFILSGCTQTNETTEHVSALSCRHLDTLSQSSFGFVNASEDFSQVTQLGIFWNQEFPGPFVWDEVQPEKNPTFNFQETDKVVSDAEAVGFSLVGILWPYAEWDQKVHGIGTECEGAGLQHALPSDRCKPNDMGAYGDFVTEIVERYDGDGLYDADGLCTPIRQWQVISSPSQQTAIGGEGMFRGEPIDYFNILRVTFNAVKGSCPQCDVFYGALEGTNEQAYVFFEEVLTLGGADYFDAVSLQTTSSGVAEHIARIQEILDSYYHPKPVWVTGITPNTPPSHESSLVRGFVEALSGGAEKVFYPQLLSDPKLVPSENTLAIIDSEGKKRPAFTALQTLIKKIGKFSQADKISEGQFKFTRDHDVPLYVLWKTEEDSAIPDILSGELRISTLDGRMEARDIATVVLSDEPIFVE
ncbi:hypothetical protein ACFL0L_02350 [Patescibacteria group bacterium]